MKVGKLAASGYQGTRNVEGTGNGVNNELLDTLEYTEVSAGYQYQPAKREACV